MKSKKRSLQGTVDIGKKPISARMAIAQATVDFGQPLDKMIAQGSPKGDVLETARIAGILAAKSTPQFIPLCHPIKLTQIKIQFEVDPKNTQVRIFATVKCVDRTGPELEALMAASSAALTIYDMMKWAGQDMAIREILLFEKQGGRSGHYKRKT